jgi:hypothetical protein
MVKTVAILALVVIAFGLSLGNYWWTFGLWPKSWGSFLGFACASLIVHGLIEVVRKSKD